MGEVMVLMLECLLVLLYPFVAGTTFWEGLAYFVLLLLVCKWIVHAVVEIRWRCDVRDDLRKSLMVTLPLKEQNNAAGENGTQFAWEASIANKLAYSLPSFEGNAAIQTIDHQVEEDTGLPAPIAMQIDAIREGQHQELRGLQNDLLEISLCIDSLDRASASCRECAISIAGDIFRMDISHTLDDTNAVEAKLYRAKKRLLDLLEEHNIADDIVHARSRLRSTDTSGGIITDSRRCSFVSVLEETRSRLRSAGRRLTIEQTNPLFEG